MAILAGPPLWMSALGAVTLAPWLLVPVGLVWPEGGVLARPWVVGPGVALVIVASLVFSAWVLGTDPTLYETYQFPELRQ